jgi:hypothetical protein
LWHPDHWGPLGRLFVEVGDRSKGAGKRRKSVEGNLQDKTKIEGGSISQALKKAYIA